MQTENVISAAWFLVGPTAVGKTAVAQYLAERTGAAILSVDAMLVYRGMDIGTAKPTPQERGEVPYFGIDLADSDESFSTGAWLARVRAQVTAANGSRGRSPSSTTSSGVSQDGGRASSRAANSAALSAAENVRFAQTRNPVDDDLIAVGGTGLYVRALVQGLDATAADPERRRYWQERMAREGVAALFRELAACAPQVAASLADPENPRRIIRALEHFDAHGALPDGWLDAPRPRVVGLHLPRADLHARIAARVEQMFAAGFLDEVAALRARFPAWRTDSHTSRSVRTVSQTHLHTSGSVQPVDEAGNAVAIADGAESRATARQAIGYAEACDLLDNRMTREQAIAQIVVRTRQLAKRQETWFRHQAEVTWIELSADEPMAAIAARVLAAWREHGPTPIRLS